MTSANTFHVGDYVVARIPFTAAVLAAARGYLPLNVPLLKQVLAVGGTSVCSNAGIINVAGKPLARPLDADSKGRSLTAWMDCRELAADELFLLNSGVPTSFDSRYFGPVKAADVRGRVTPLWTWSTRK